MRGVALAPAPVVALDPRLALLRRVAPSVVRRRLKARDRRVQREALDLLGIRGGEEAGQRRPLALREEVGARSARRGEDRPQIVHLLLEGGEREPVRHAAPATVEQDQPAERGQPPERSCDTRLAPEVLYRGDPRRDEDQVARPLAHHLIGEVYGAVAGVSCPGDVHRRASIAPANPRNRGLHDLASDREHLPTEKAPPTVRLTTASVQTT